MRCDQYIGLNDWASNWLNRYQREATILEIEILDNGQLPIVHGFKKKTVTDLKVEVVGKIHGAWDSHVADLHRYTLPNLEVFEEFIQAEPWSSGPCYFIALKSSGMVVEQSLWTEEEIANA